jgi:hypothetical protein
MRCARSPTAKRGSKTVHPTLCDASPHHGWPPAADAAAPRRGAPTQKRGRPSDRLAAIMSVSLAARAPSVAGLISSGPQEHRSRAAPPASRPDGAPCAGGTGTSAWSARATAATVAGKASKPSASATAALGQCIRRGPADQGRRI